MLKQMLVMAALVWMLSSGQAPLAAQQRGEEQETPSAKQDAKQKSAAVTQQKWVPLFDGKTLGGWEKTKFGGEGDVGVEKGVIELDMGYPLSGITYKKKFPKTNYELYLEARKVEGEDFFLGLTFPVAESHCSLILGGWGGAVVGLSSINGSDASGNETTRYKLFKNHHWYKVRLKVTKTHITMWMDGKQMIHQDLRDREISTRVEVDLSKPLGIATFETQASYRNLRYRELTAAEQDAGKKPREPNSQSKRD